MLLHKINVASLLCKQDSKYILKPFVLALWQLPYTWFCSLKMHLDELMALSSSKLDWQAASINCMGLWGLIHFWSEPQGAIQEWKFGALFIVFSSQCTQA